MIQPLKREQIFEWPTIENLKRASLEKAKEKISGKREELKILNDGWVMAIKEVLSSKWWLKLF